MASAGVGAIALRGVSKRYGQQLALQPLDLDIAEGEFFCLLGPSGCGKTTTLNLIGGFVAPTSGEISIRGQRVDALPPNKRDVNTVFQSYALFPNMTVGENIAFGLKMARVPVAERRRRVDEVLELVGLTENAGRLPAQMSGGQQQRVAVARALVNRPAVLLLDEPLGALDLKLRKHLQVELAQIHREVGTIFVYVTHDQEEAMALADRIAIMQGGRLEQIGTPTEIYSRPASRFVAEFIGESNIFEVEIDPREPGCPAILAGRRLPCVGTGVHGVGRATLVVRPEAIDISTTPRNEAPLVGEVIQQSFLGNYTRLAVRCEASPMPVIVEVHGPRTSSVGALVPGTAVWLSWEDEAGVLIPPQ